MDSSLTRDEIAKAKAARNGGGCFLLLPAPSLVCLGANHNTLRLFWAGRDDDRSRGSTAGGQSFDPRFGVVGGGQESLAGIVEEEKS